MPIRILPFLACRFFALYALYNPFIELSRAWGASIFYYIQADVDPILSHRETYADLMASVALGLFFWLKAEWLSEKITGKYRDYVIGADFQMADIQTAAFAVVGLAVMSNALQPLGHFFWDLFNVIDFPRATSEIDKIFYHRMLNSMIWGILWLVWGFFIFYNAPWLTRISRKYVK